MMNKEEFLQLIKNQLIVSSQAYPGEALYGAETMAKMSLAAKKGGAVAIRANGKEDIIAIKKATLLPTIGIVKQTYMESEVYITPTLKEVQELIESGTEVIALDATNRKRPGNVSLYELVKYIKENSEALIMGDISVVSEGIEAISCGCDFVSTTLSGYTDYSPQKQGPDTRLIEQLAKMDDLIVIAEGRIRNPADLFKVFEKGAHSAVVGTAITRPETITAEFVKQLKFLSSKG